MRRRWPWAVLACAVLCGIVNAEQASSITGDRLGGFVLPVEPLSLPFRMSALRAFGWRVDDTQRLVLEGDAVIEIGQRRYRAPAATVWLNRLPTADGLVNQFAIYVEHLQDGANRSGLSIAAGALLITGSTRGTVKLDVALFIDGRPESGAPGADLAGRGQARLAAHLQRLVVDPPVLADRPQLKPFASPSPPLPVPGGSPRLPAEPTLLDPTTGAPLDTGRRLPLFQPEGTLHFTTDGEVTIIGGTDEDVAIVTGSIVASYSAVVGGEWNHLTLTAQRAVVFADPGTLQEALGGPNEAGSIRGIYLEGNVVATANEGDYMVRAPHMYYDLETDQAIMLEAVLRTYPRDGRLPVYARAEEMRQISANQWKAKRATISTSEFFVPHIAMGASRVTVTQRPGSDPADEDDTHFDSTHNTLEVGGLPIMYWPNFSGKVEDFPLRGISVGSRSTEGLRIRTRWDAYTLLGIDRKPGWEAILQADGFSERGGAVGLELGYNEGDMRGFLDVYGMYDQGVDRTSSGLDVDPQQEYRGVALWDHDWRPTEHWTVQSQVSWISDPTFITTWREDDFYVRREYETSLYAIHRKENTAFIALAQYELNDFISNSWLLASRAYQVDRLPELGYYRFGDSLLNDTLTYTGNVGVSRMRLRLEEGTPEELGVPGAAFGIPDDASIAASLEAQGLQGIWVSRFDTRHELAAPMSFGAIKAVPFVVGRLTAYDEDITFSSDGDQTRLFGAAGVRVSTQLTHVDNSVESRLWGLHRIRHIIEPRIVAWVASSNISQNDLPVYDENVESIGTGAVIEAALRNTWQTQRGGPGRWNTVNVLTVDAAVVLNSSDADRESPNPQFFPYRPEYSQFGDHVRASGVWLVSDTLSFAGEATYDLESSNVSRGAIGTELRHTPNLTTFIEYRFLDASNNELLDIAWAYRLTPKYRVALSPQWDFLAQDFRSVSVSVVRRFPDFDLTIQVTRDEIADQTTFGAAIGVVEF